MKIRPVGGEVPYGRTDRRTYIKLTFRAFSNFANAPKITSQLMLYREIIAVCSEIHTKHINTAVWAERRIAEC